ncbi:hemerythrin domain-containing protein [Acinetobacter sp. HY1485]|uniref:hemerythrin domain-containing protein n=1 Tax=Acinetobacter sp. HY1485 TaxID=2970918 RepID=UPI0022B962E4|nr:hemerythrin domain-containing protein [Acinetobacter sp. HY1485]
MSVSIWLKSFFGSQNTSENNLNLSEHERTIDKNTQAEQIHYNENLVNNLKEDHQKLLFLYGSIVESGSKFQYAQILEKLQQFKKTFNIQLYSKNVKLYAYLEQSLKEEIEEFKKIRIFRREMRNLETEINKFLNTWIDIDLSSHNIQEFSADLREIGQVLVKRIESEENLLYPIYAKAA